MQYTITKVRIKNLTLEVNMEEVIKRPDKPSITNEIQKKSDLLIHPDFQSAMVELIPHMVLICDQKEASDAEVIILAENSGFEIETVEEHYKPRMNVYSVTGFSLAGEGEHAGVVLIGQKTLEGGKVLNLISPFSKYAEYKYGSELAEIVNRCIGETQLYLFEGKCAEDNQLKLDLFGEEQENTLSDTKVTVIHDGKEVDVTAFFNASPEKQKKMIRKAQEKLKEQEGY